LAIFICPMNGQEFGKVQNAGAPLNTQYDDFAAIVNPNLRTGYISSNRSGGSGGDDIYSFDILKNLNIGKKIQGIAKDKDGTAIPRTFITLIDDKGTVLDTVTTSDDGAYTFLAVSDKNFKLTGNKIKYTEGSTVTNTFGKDFIVKADVVLLTKKEIIEQKIEKSNDLVAILELNPIYFDLDKSNIRPDAEVELAKIIEIMNDHPNMVVELSSYTDCRESKKYNQVLSDKRAKASVDYIKAKITKPERITGKGYGETNLVNACSCDDNIGANCTEAEHQKNRRTEFTIVKK
jgi:outer membrane protein OmpA-like peptidoglycan-associated protein